MYKKAQVCYYYENEKCIMTINLDYEKDEDYGNKWKEFIRFGETDVELEI